MAHQIEIVNGEASMFWVEKLPWHGLGTELQGNPSVEEAIVAGGLDWQVDLIPLVTHDRHEKAPARAVRRHTDNTILGVVGQGYHALQNTEAFNWFQPFLDAGLASLHTGGSLQGGRKVWHVGKDRAKAVSRWWRRCCGEICVAVQQPRSNHLCPFGIHANPNRLCQHTVPGPQQVQRQQIGSRTAHSTVAAESGFLTRSY